MSQITMSQALAEVTLLTKKILKGTSIIKVGSSVKKDCVVVGFASNEAFLASIAAKRQSVVDLMLRRTQLKTTIFLSNTENKVTIAGNEMPIIEALMLRETHTLFQEALDKHERKETVDVMSTINRASKVAQNEINKTLSSLSSEASTDTIEALTKQLTEANELILVAPEGLLERIDGTSDKYQELLTEIDHALSVSNALTNIEV